ncbi:GNAT family N-acetyltransferase [Faecalispora anaeroviscerum]|uniref:GNAT family N-acetyltransferase n=1 Tax=Faecalispora anaeroviscerum TaxID=2991836 RepID=UPI0024B8E18F|nr:GNAT family N-acetyltransferase [Faecalispora anaeroviscerum]
MSRLPANNLHSGGNIDQKGGDFIVDFKWEPLSAHHAEELLNLWGDEDVIRYTAIPSPCLLEQIRSRIDNLSAFDVFVIRVEDEVVGVVGCIPMEGPQERYGVFYQLKKIFWGKAFATHMVDEMLMKMKEKSPSAVFYADVVADNIASEKILRHFDFQCISVEQDGFERDGSKMDVRHYMLSFEGAKS